MIRTEGLTKTFGSVVAVDDLNLEIEEGTVFGFLGPNGAGKTTTIRMLCSLISPTKGKSYVMGLDTSIKEEALKIRAKIGLLPEATGLYDSLSAFRNLDFYARLYGLTDRHREESIERFLRMFEIWERRDEPVGNFSKGMRQKIAIARALVHDPSVLFLDEPTSGLDPQAAKTVRDFILDLKREKRTIFLNTHNLDEADRICDRIGIIKNRLIALGSPSDLRNITGKTKTAIHLLRIDDLVIDAMKRSKKVKSFEVSANLLLCEVEDPGNDNPAIVEEIVRAGGKIQYVTEVRHSLEDTYLKLLNEAQQS